MHIHESVWFYSHGGGSAVNPQRDPKQGKMTFQTEDPHKDRWCPVVLPTNSVKSIQLKSRSIQRLNQEGSVE